MAKDSVAKLGLLLFLFGGVLASDDPRQSPAQQEKNIITLMCTTETCTDAVEAAPGCKSYATPLNKCYNAQNLFPNDPSWSDLDIYDEMIMKNLKRTFYQSKDGSCAGRGEASNAVPEPVDGEEDSFILPLDVCVGPFGPPRPWGKFSISSDDEDDYENESEVLSAE